MIKPEPASGGACYEIKIQGRLDERWSSWFNGLAIRSEAPDGEVPTTTLAVRVPDQARLRGILNKIWDMNLNIISVICLGDSQTQEG